MDAGGISALVDGSIVKFTTAFVLGVYLLSSFQGIVSGV
jgi:hypothetical protein